MTDAPTTASVVEESKTADDDVTTEAIATKDDLLSGNGFRPLKTDSVFVPEIGKTVKIRNIGFKRSLGPTKTMSEHGVFSLEYRAALFAQHVVEPRLSVGEWKKVLSRDDLAQSAVARIHGKINALDAIGEEEEAAAADEFPGTED